MNVERFLANDVVKAAKEREEKDFFGQGWSHFEEDFSTTVDDIVYRLSVYNTPKHIQVNWNIRVSGMPSNGAGWPWGNAWVNVALTTEESRQVAQDFSISITDWLDRAMKSCRTDVSFHSLTDGSCPVGFPGD